MSVLNRVFWGAAFLSLGCDDIVNVRNLAPEVEFIGLCVSGERVFFELAVQDFEEDDVDVEITATGKPILVGGVGDGALGLRTDRRFPGKHHWIEWAASACEGETVCPTALCHTLQDGPIESSRCIALVDAPLAAVVSVVATDGEDTSIRQTPAGGALGGSTLSPCDFESGAHE